MCCNLRCLTLRESLNKEKREVHEGEERHKPNIHDLGVVGEGSGSAYALVLTIWEQLQGPDPHPRPRVTEALTGLARYSEDGKLP